MMSAEPCGYCGAYHGVRCPSVQAIEYYPNGTVKRVEFITPQPINVDWSNPVRVPVGPTTVGPNR